MIELKHHQRRVLDQLGNGKILWGGMGSGKSFTSLVYFYERVCQGVIGDFGSLRSPRDLYVITTAKKRDSLDWQKDATKLGIGTERDASVGGITIVVDSWNNISKYKGVKDAFFIFDEQRLVGSGTWTKSFISIAKQNDWILLSATPGDTWIDYIPVFVANGFYKNRTEFKREHVIYNTYSKFPKIDRYVGVGKLVRLRNQILVHMPYDSHTVWNRKDVIVDFDKNLFDKATIGRWHVFEHRPLRDVAELFLVMRKIVNSDPSRLDAIRQLMDRHPKLIVFYNFDYELEALRSLAKEEIKKSHLSLSDNAISSRNVTADVISRSTQTKSTSAVQKYNSTRMSSDKSSGKNSKEKEITSDTTSNQEMSTAPETVSGPETGLEVAEWNGHKHEPLPDGERWLYLVQYTAGSEGWNCTTTDAMAFYSLTYSWKAFHQSHGRIDRLNTPYTNLYYYYLVSKSVIDRAIKKSLDEKHDFNQASFMPNLKGN